MKTVLQNVKTGSIEVDDVPATILKPNCVLVRNVCSLVSAGTEKAVLDFSKANYLKKARMRPDLFRKVLARAKNDGIWETYKVVSNLIDQPIQLGYSCAGVVTAVSDEITDVRVGDRVACAGLFAATHSEVICVPRNLVCPMPDDVSFEVASFVALGATSMQGLRLSEATIGETVVVYGLGLVGMISAQLALAAGCRVIGVDLDPGKIAAAEKVGVIGVAANADMPKRILGLTGGYGADKVLMCAATKSNEPVTLVPEITRQKGILVVVGDVPLDIPRRAYFEKEIDIRISRSYGPGRYDPSYEEGGLDYPIAYVRWTENRNMQSFLELAGRGKLAIESLISHRFPIADAESAYEIIEGKRKEPYLGMVIRYADDEPTGEVRAAVSVSDRASAGEVRLGVIGAGNFAKAFLLPALAAQSGVKFERVATASGVSAKAVAEKYSARVATSDPTEIFEDRDVNAVVIATRHDSHADYVCRALEAGQAVFVEKPLAITLEELERVRRTYDSVREHGGKPFLMVGFNRRFSPLATTLRDSLGDRSGPWAVHYRVNAGFVPPSEWVHDERIGGGRVIGECCHFVDFITSLTGTLPRGVIATCARDEGRGVPDVLSITVDYEDGSIGTIHYFSNGSSSMAKERIEAFRGGACAELQNFRSLSVHGAKANGKRKYMNQVKGFREEAEAFTRAVRNGEPSPIPFDQIHTTTLVTLRVAESLAQGRRIEIDPTGRTTKGSDA